ncbi:hypothetical protein PVAND_003615 [Polypedilum vanderplanki]|uniref:Uncharacterized protein n=1 Tax=Polypedilum vanderplanki TaxID=319348 RepID=A0A9J6BVM3_POLVA|nr:hypothetical protein PVAND_003615 [Polypedilum vanderplanki]
MLQPDPSYHLKIQEPVHSINFLSQQLLTGTASGKIKFFCLSSLRSNFELKVSSNGGILYVSSDTETLICQDRQGIIKIYDLEKCGYVAKNEINTEHIGFTRCIKLMNRDLLLTPSGSSDINVYDLRTSIDPIYKLSSFQNDQVGQIMCMIDVSLTSQASETIFYLIAGFESGHLVLFDLREFKAIHSIKYDFPVCSVDYDASTNRGVLSSPTIHKIHIFGIDRLKMELIQKEAECIELQHSEGSKVAGISSLKIRIDKKCLFVGSCDGVVNIFSWKSLRKLATLRNHRNEITDIAFSAIPIDSFKSNLSAISSTDGTVSLWDIYYK